MQPIHTARIIISMILLLSRTSGSLSELQFLGEPQFTAHVSHAAPPGTIIYTFVVINDSYSRLNNVISFSLIEDSSNSELFELDSVSGQLVSLRYLPLQSWVLQVKAETDSASIQTEFNVIVEPEYEVLPIFERDRLEFSLSEYTPAGSLFGIVRAFSLDQLSIGEPSYCIISGNAGSDIGINATSGILSVARELDYETTYEYDLTVEYSDDAALARATVVVIVLDENDNHPHFTEVSYGAMVRESDQIGSSVFIVSANDLDSRQNGEIEYSILETDSGFMIDRNSGEVVTTKLFDYEDRTVHRITVIASDKGNPVLTSSVIVEVQVINENDECAVFQSSYYNITIPYESIPDVGSVVATVEAVDPDNIGVIIYSIDSSTTQTALSLNSSTGSITLLDPTPSKYTLLVSASDDHDCHTSATVVINVGSTNMHSPRFTAPCEGSVRENCPEGTTVATLEALDDDTGIYGDVLFSFIKSSQSEFSIDSETGVVVVKSDVTIDYEEDKFFLIDVLATDKSNRQAYCLLNISVQDKNDNAPMFLEYSQLNRNVSIPNPPEVGMNVVRLLAEDGDSGMNGEVHYSLVDPQNFAIDPTTGEITVASVPMNQSMYSLTIVASNEGVQPVLSSTINLTVHLTNNGIAFNRSIYRAEVCENIGVSSTILRVSTDAIPSTVHHYTLISGSLYSSNGEDVFNVNTQGELTVGSQAIVDYEKLPNKVFLFSISAFVPPPVSPQSSVATVEITVKDDDDNQPYFPTAPSQYSIPENSPIGTTVARIPAIDTDSGTNGEIAYSILDGVDQFNVTENGEILTNVEIDAENITVFSFFLNSFNPNPVDPNACIIDTRLNSFAPVVISVIDINDNAPIFTNVESSLSLSEDTPLGTTINTFSAVDADVNSVSSDIWFSISDGGIRQNFVLTKDGHLILVKALDYEVESTIPLTILVSDGGNSNTNEFTISVTDIDDEPPVFDASSYSATVMENVPLGTTVIEVSAIDIDSDIVTYRLTGSAKGRLSINEVGVITVSGIIDREEFENGILSFTVVAEGGRRAIANVTVNISDVNDCAPRFPSIEDMVIQENLFPGTEGIRVGSIIAYDADTGRNGEIVYSLRNGEENGFVIDPMTGEITAQMTYNRESVSSYTLVVEARDMGEEIQLSTRTSFQIKIGDEDDNPPYFPYPYMYTRIFEDSVLNSVVFHMPAVDMDEGTNAESVFSLLPSESQTSQFFSLDEATGVVVLTHALDYENEDERLFTLSVSVADLMNEYTSYATLDIEILDRNDNPPVIQTTQRPLGSTVPEDTPVGTVILEISATDADSGSNADLVYTIASGDPSRHFSLSVSGNNAGVTVVKQLDYETITNYSLLIDVCDQGIPPHCDTLPAAFSVGNIDDVVPSFSRPFYQGSVRENLDPINSILQVEASDLDSEGNFVYQIQSGNVDGKFAIDSTTGVIGSTTSLDREEQDSYVLVITAADEGGTPLTGTGTAIITVLDTDDNPPAEYSEWRVFMLLLDGNLPQDHSVQLNFGDPDPSSSFSDCATRSSQQIGIYFGLDNDNCLLSLNKGNTPVNDYSLTVGTEAEQGNIVSKVQIDVAHISLSDVAIHHLVTISLATTTEDYLRNAYSVFPDALSSIFGVSQEKVTIVSVKNGYQDSVNTVDISFIVESIDGSYLHPALIIQTLYKEKNQLQYLIGYELSSLPTDPCSSEPCAPQASCTPTTSIIGSSITAMSSSFVLVAPVVELGYKCECIPGTAGNNCSINFDDCYSTPCQFGAECIDEVNGYRCECPPGTSGDNCQISPNGCSSNPCLNAAECRDTPGFHSCLCLPGYYGSECQYHHFRTALTCEPSPCLNGGTCSPGRDSFSCLCPETHSGSLCEIESVALGCSGNPCYNGSTCMEADSDPICSCSVGFTGPNCRWPIDNCELEPCLNGGICATGLYGSYQCYCPLSYTGDDCEDFISGCESNPCQNGARCSDLSYSNDYTCECKSGFTGTNCEYEVDPLNLCLSEPCTTGNCTYYRDSYTCSCPTNYSGDLCSVPVPPTTPCESNPCLHGGICTVVDDSEYNCSCSNGFTSDNCQININDCSSNPCLYGTCQDGIDGYTCECDITQITGYNCQVWCPSGLSGDFCEDPAPQCDLGDCLNGGTCVENTGGDGYSCSCPPTHTGPSCENENSCNSVECFNGGSCTDLTQGGFGCVCTDGFDGSNCQLLTVSFTTSPTGASYQAYPSLHLSAKGTIEFEFNTVDSEGLLLYNTQLQSGLSKDYISVEVEGGRLAIGLSHGGENVRLIPDIWVSDGQWHRVTINIIEKRTSVTVDWCHELDDETGTTAGCHLTVDSQGERGFLDLGLPLWLGGAPSLSSPHISANTITACLRQVLINGVLLDLNSHVDQINSQPGCPQLEHQCSQGECGEGDCVPTWRESPVCDCPSLLSGDLCNTGAPSVSYSGSGYARYSLTEEGVRHTRQSETQIRSTYEETVSLTLRTTNADCFLFGMYGEDREEYLYLMLESGEVVLHLSLDSRSPETEFVQQTNGQLNDSESHSVIVHRRGSYLNLSLDSNTTFYSLLPATTSLTLETFSSQIYTGGSPFISASLWFSGCLQDVRLNQITLPSGAEGNEFASVVYETGDEGEEGEGGHGVTDGCSFSLCYLNPCGSGGMCQETNNNSYMCECSNGEVLYDGVCPLKQEEVVYLPYVISAVAFVALAVLVALSVFVGVCIRRRRIKKRTYLVQNNEKMDSHEMAEFFSPSQAVVISNEQGGGEEDASEMDWAPMAEKCTPSTNRKSSPQTSKSTSSKGSPESKASSRSSGKNNREGREKYHFHLRTSEKEDVDGEEEEGEEEGFRSNSPVIRAYLEERVDAANDDLLSVDSLRKFEEEGSEDSEVDSLSSVICHSNEEDEDNEEGYTLERLQAAGPPLSSLVPLLRHVLQSTAEISTRVSPSSTTTTLLTPYNTQ